MKKTIALLLALLLLLPLTLAVRAGGGIALSLSRAEGRVGDVAEVTLSAADNPGIISLQVKVKYDETKLELLSVKDGGILGKEIKHQKELTSPYVLSWENYVATENFTENGALCTLSFRILAGEEGEKIPVTMEVGDYGVMNFDLKDLPRTLEYGSVTVTGTAKASGIMPWLVLGGIALIPVASVVAVVLYDKLKKSGKKA